LIDQPLVSIVLIFLNEEKFIADAVESVFNQTYKNWELILVDDGSQDKSTEMAKRWAADNKDKVFYFDHPGHTNQGMSASRNLGFKKAKGSLIAFVDADDVWLAIKLEEQVEVLNEFPKATLLYGLAEYWRDWTSKPKDVGRNSIPCVKKMDYLARPPELLLSAYPLGEETAPSPSCMIFRRELIDRVGGFEESFKGMYEDQAFLTKVYLKEPIYVSSHLWIRYRIHSDSCCSKAHAAGEYHHYRYCFLRWLWRHMAANRIKHFGAWRALITALFPYRLPRVYRILFASKNIVGNLFPNLVKPTN